MNLRPYSTPILALGGSLLAAMGMYFVFLRPPLLPEDLRYIGSTLQNTKENIPGLLNWLQKVFWVMGGYIFTTGLLIIVIAFTSFRKRLRGAFSIVIFTGISSIGLMTVVNFMIGSDFKWVLLTFTLPWIIALRACLKTNLGESL
ncbi:hypothetical protein JM83_3815 [Gillisia sp. Hel_I_86]|uniref:hypothetical protein n=1 Tax=Gillisia sp. Hel_I_86 TaxID=1249981 RepID=UPI001199968E|nr:hypothetical protein [Gillisia sp. Hel_I_86]TVZ28671.1 hypothetical protein JM83_3815 [Gillisia sp. Hel_I_86]